MGNLYRHNQVLEILRSHSITTQSDLREALAQRGIHVTQATVSRDIEDLGIVKTRDGYHAPAAPEAAAPPQPSLAVILKEFLREVRIASNLVVVRTHPGNAHSVAVALDSTGWPEVVGTVAGDDTIFLATSGPRQAGRVRERILGVLQE